MASPSIGALRHRVTFQRPVTAFDAYGQPLHGDAAYEDVQSVWAELRPLGSSERLAAAQMQSGQTLVLTTHYTRQLAAATGAWRVLYGPRRLGIIGLPRDMGERHAWLVFDCSETRND